MLWAGFGVQGRAAMFGMIVVLGLGRDESGERYGSVQWEQMDRLTRGLCGRGHREMLAAG